jgi:hypothetical protein
MWECSKCGQKSEKKVSDSNGCEHQWWDEHDIAKAKEKQAKGEKINRAVFAFNDELLNTEDGQKKLKGESGWNWLKGNKGGDKINAENIDIDKDIAICWLNSFFGKEWLAGEYGKQYASYLNDTEIWAKDKFSNGKNTELSDQAEMINNILERLISKINEPIKRQTEEKKAMLCSNCRDELEENANFCANCGTKVGGTPKAAEVKIPSTSFSDKERRKMLADLSSKDNMDKKQDVHSLYLSSIRSFLKSFWSWGCLIPFLFILICCIIVTCIGCSGVSDSG